MRSMLILAILLFINTAFGCSKPLGAPPVKGNSDSNEMSESNREDQNIEESYSEMNLIVSLTRYESDNTEGTRTTRFKNLTPELVKEKFESLEWTNKDHHCGMTLHQGKPQTDSYCYLYVGSGVLSDDSKHTIHADLRDCVEEETSNRNYYIDSIESPEIALNLLLSFLEKDDKYLTLVKWEEE